MVRPNEGVNPDSNMVDRLTHGLGTCYVVIAMRNMFVEGELPGETPTTSAGSDISSFTELYQHAQDIYGKCSNPEVNEPGWYPAGMFYSTESAHLRFGQHSLTERFQVI